MAQLMPLLLTVSCFSKIQIGFTFLVPAHLGSPGQRAIKRVCVCVLLSDSAVFSGILGLQLPGAAQVWRSRLCVQDHEFQAADGSARSDQDRRRVHAELDGGGQGSWRQQKG